MGTKQGYAITTWRLRLRCKHPEWLETTQNFYNEIQKFYYDLYLERSELWNENSQNALRGLETLSIPGRTRKQVEYPLPWNNALLYFRRSAANAAIAAVKSYLTRSAGGYAGKTETFHSAVTYYKGMYRELTSHLLTAAAFGNGPAMVWNCVCGLVTNGTGCTAACTGKNFRKTDS